jgi:RNA-directed DNA polymerase
MRAISKFLKSKLKLTINEEKSGIRKPISFELLGFGFVPTYKKGDRGRYQLVVTKLLSGDEYLRKTERLRRVASESTALLYLASLEKERKEKEEPYPIGCPSR